MFCPKYVQVHTLTIPRIRVDSTSQTVWFSQGNFRNGLQRRIPTLHLVPGETQWHWKPQAESQFKRLRPIDRALNSFLSSCETGVQYWTVSTSETNAIHTHIFSALRGFYPIRVQTSRWSSTYTRWNVTYSIPISFKCLSKTIQVIVDWRLNQISPLLSRKSQSSLITLFKSASAGRFANRSWL
jgi:hypothetical protein